MDYREFVNQAFREIDIAKDIMKEHLCKNGDEEKSNIADFICDYFKQYLEKDEDGMSQYVNGQKDAIFHRYAFVSMLNNTISGNMILFGLIKYDEKTGSIICVSERLLNETLENLVLRFRVIIVASVEPEYYEMITNNSFQPEFNQFHN